MNPPIVYTFSSLVINSAIAAAVVAAVIAVLALWLRRGGGLLYWSTFFALADGLIVAPMLAMDRVVLDDEKLEQTTGFWFSPTVKGFRFADTKRVEIVVRKSAKHGAYEVWQVKTNLGNTIEIDPGDLWESNIEDIVRRLRERGFDVRN